MRHTTIEMMAIAAAVPCSAAVASPPHLIASAPVRRTETLLSIEETIAVLVRRLGTPVAWAAWLADIRRTPREGYPVPDLHGHQLYPVGPDRVSKQPKYRMADVLVFIKAILTADPGIKKANSPRRFVFDDYGPLQPWRTRKVRPVIPIKPAALFKRKKRAA